MSLEIQELIDAYFDDSLSPKQLHQLSQWIKSSPLNAQQFASNLMLHDRLRNEFMAKDDLQAEDNANEAAAHASSLKDRPATDSGKRRRWMKSIMAMVATVCVMICVAIFFENGFGTSSVSAAVGELNRIIVANQESEDRTFLISVEQSMVSRRFRDQLSQEHLRPPKPSLDKAILAVRDSNKFVLKRKVDEDVWFITGSNGNTSWAVRPDGPVRCSNDLNRFNRDLPGHEWSLPINNLNDGLRALQSAYNLQVQTVEDSLPSDQSKTKGCRRMLAARKPRCRGASRCEITYSESSGQIREMRFVKMPYGRNIVTLKMTLIDEQPLAADYFDHQYHHDASRTVEVE